VNSLRGGIPKLFEQPFWQLFYQPTDACVQQMPIATSTDEKRPCLWQIHAALWCVFMRLGRFLDMAPQTPYATT